MKKNILLVDDDVAWLSSHKEVIEVAFNDLFQLSYAESASEALRIFEKSKPDLLITDLEMEKISSGIVAGEYLIKKVLEKLPQMKIIIISGAPDIAKVAERNNIYGYIPKWSLNTYPLQLKMKLVDIFGIKSEIC